MKQIKYFFVFSIFFIFLFFGALNITASQFPDVLKLQPIPSGVYPGNSNKSRTNSAPSQMSQYEFNENNLDPNASHIDTIEHLLFIADTDNNRVFIFNLNEYNTLVDYVPDYVLGQPNFIATDPGTTQSTLNGPTGITYDATNHLLFVADTNNNRIMVFDVSSINNGENAVNVLGQPDFTSSDSGDNQSSINNPYSLEYDPVQRLLFVADVNNNRIMIFNTASTTNGENAVNVLGQPDFTSSDSGATLSRLNNPNGIAYDSASHNLFVADIKNNRIMVFGVASVSNGEEAVNIINSNGDLATNPLMSPEIIDRLQSKSKINANLQRKNVSFGAILFWAVVILIIEVVTVRLILYFVKNRKKGIIK